MNIRSLVTAVLLGLLAAPSSAEVLDSAANGFTVKHSLTVNASRAETYAAAVNQFSSWWHPDHSISGIADNLYIDAKPHGCFCEKLGTDGGVIHMSVTFVNPQTMLRFTGGLGPLGLMGLNGNLTWEFKDTDEGTLVIWQYAVGGYLDGGLDQLAAAVDGVLLEQVTRLKALIETGQPEPAPPSS